MSNIAFIGLGNMGAPMAANLVKAGHAVTGFDLVEAAKTAAAASGVPIAPSAAEAVANADTVVTMLPAGRHVLAAHADLLPVTPKGAIIVGPAPIYHHGVIGLIGPVNQAARAYLHRSDLVVYVAQRPREYQQAPPELRVTIAPS